LSFFVCTSVFGCKTSAGHIQLVCIYLYTHIFICTDNLKTETHATRLEMIRFYEPNQANSQNGNVHYCFNYTPDIHMYTQKLANAVAFSRSCLSYTACTLCKNSTSQTCFCQLKCPSISGWRDTKFMYRYGCGGSSLTSLDAQKPIKHFWFSSKRNYARKQHTHWLRTH